MTDAIVILLVLAFALLALLWGWAVLDVSAREEEDQRRWVETMRTTGSANWDYSADDTETEN